MTNLEDYKFENTFYFFIYCYDYYIRERQFIKLQKICRTTTFHSYTLKITNLIKKKKDSHIKYS